jgi:hypothetical protein
MSRESDSISSTYRAAHGGDRPISRGTDNLGANSLRLVARYTRDHPEALEQPLEVQEEHPVYRKGREKAKPGIYEKAKALADLYASKSSGGDEAAYEARFAEEMKRLDKRTPLQVAGEYSTYFYENGSRRTEPRRKRKAKPGQKNLF